VSLSPSLVWFRLDLRLRDNPALAAAVARGAPLLPVWVLDEEEGGRWSPGAASRWWLHHSLAALRDSLNGRGLPMILRRGRAAEVIPALVAETGAGAVYWNRRYEPEVIARDSRLKEQLRAAGIEAKSFNAALLHEPQEVSNKQGGPFQVFTPFWRTCLTRPILPVVELPKGRWSASTAPVPSETIEGLGLLPQKNWASQFSSRWWPGEAGAVARLEQFFDKRVERYADQRDEPASEAISELSPHLHFGETSPRLIWARALDASRESGVFPSSRGVQKFLAEVGWREFAHHLLYHFPTTPEAPLRPEYAAFPWADDPHGEKTRAWRRGRTGYPIVDAGMRELWATGWMHNRVRMVAASFLVKHLRQPWLCGAEWFWDTLVDADLASNTLGWQWTAGCGADAAPYFRIFNPVLQGEKFDPEGAYVRRWVPELAKIPKAFLHRPWEAPAHILSKAGVELGETYPRPLVNHAQARDEALAALSSLRARPQPAIATRTRGGTVVGFDDRDRI
jgi:deoxyribodipyrimidine photo-lyase